MDYERKLLIAATATSFVSGIVAGLVIHQATSGVTQKSDSETQTSPTLEPYDPADEEQVDRQTFTTNNIPKSYTLNDTEYAELQAWVTGHRTAHRPGKGLIFGQYELRFWASSIGDYVNIHCRLCGEFSEITDIDKF